MAKEWQLKCCLTDFFRAPEKCARPAARPEGGAKDFREEVAIVNEESTTGYDEPRVKGEPSGVRPDESVIGPYRLGAVIRRSPMAAVYETEFSASNGEARPAVIKVRELDVDSADAAVRRWRGAMKLDHPHLLHLYDAGSSPAGGATAAWVVMERADESLSGVLAHRALSEDEVGEMLEPVLDALVYLHRNGYAHGALSPSNILAAGDQLKLSCDSAVRVSDGGVPAEDIRAIGALIPETLTERGPHGVVRHPSGRFSEIVRRCAEPNPAKRWTAEQIAAYLNHKDSLFSEQSATAAAGPQLAGKISKPPSRSFPKWIFTGLAAIVLIVLLTALLRTSRTRPASVRPLPPPTSAAPGAASPAPVVQFEPAPAKPEPFSKNPQLSARKADGWSVIVAAYGSRDAAEKRMNSLAKRWPAFHLQVSEHTSERAPWLVTIGDNLSEEKALALRTRAARTGLARDAYIKRIR